MLALGLLTKLREPERPQLILLDDIDRGLHLGAQASLVKALRDLLNVDPQLQIVCTTHSPYLLDLFAPAEVRVLALDSERRTHARALTEHPDFGNWKFGTQTGELWAALGESNERRGAQAARVCARGAIVRSDLALAPPDLSSKYRADRCQAHAVPLVRRRPGARAALPRAQPLYQRGEHNGAREFLDHVHERILPVFGYRSG
ncbi:MAG TPA: AAA family ATPase [Kofleriaceae bacterium]|nr:AAA family ATPase [Kofleriaceae bacterium]